MMDASDTQQSMFSLTSHVRSKSVWFCSCSKESGWMISVQGQTISCLIGNSCITSDEDLAHNLILKVENEFSRRSYSISWHPGLSCLPAAAKGTDVVSVRGRNERTSEFIGSFWKVHTTVRFVWCFVSWKLHRWNGICVLPTHTRCSVVSYWRWWGSFIAVRCYIYRVMVLNSPKPSTTCTSMMTKLAVQQTKCTSPWERPIWISHKSTESAQARILWVKPSWGNSAVTRWDL